MAGYIIPSEYKQHSDPGVPTKARIEDQAAEVAEKAPVVYDQFFIPPDAGKTKATLLPKAQLYPEGGTSVMKLATARPRMPDPKKLLDLTNPVVNPANIVANLGMDLADERAWTKFLVEEAAKAVNGVVLRKVVTERAQDQKIDAALRRAIMQRVLLYWRGQQVEKALYIGPRGGKWADPKHTIPWDPKKHAPGKKIHVIDVTTRPKPKAEKQIGLFDEPPTKALGEEGEAGTKAPVEPRPAPAPKTDPALVIPKPAKKPSKKRREKAVEVGEHVWGSRADKAVKSADDLKDLSPEDQAKYATKRNLMPTPAVDELLEANWTPSAIVLRRAIESCVQSKAPNSLLERQDYMNGVDFLMRSMDGCRTAQDVEDFLIDWMNLASGKRRDKTYSPAELEAIRQEYLKANNITQTLTTDEIKAKEKERDELWVKIRDAEIAKVSKRDKQYQAWMERAKELNLEINAGREAYPSEHSMLKWKLNLPRYGGLSIEYKRDGSVVTYLDDPELSAKDNSYDAMAKALGPRMINLVKTGGTHSSWSRKGQTPKVYKDARRVARAMQGESPDKQLEMLTQITGGKGKKPRIKRPPYRWEREVPGEIDRVGGKEVTTADPKAFAKDFNLQNIQFGHWVTEEDADTHLRGAHGALFDLADILGVDPKTIGLNGRLSIGIGARGAGKARAHYETGKQIINITKIAGGGSLAHEWAHALDNILSVAADPEATQADMFLTAGNVKGVAPEVKDALDEVMATIRWGGDAELLEIEKRHDELLARRSRKEKLSYSERREMREYQRALKSRQLEMSTFLADAVAIGGAGKNAYWSRPHEMFARAFEAFIEDTLEDEGRRSSYLVSGTKKEYVTGRKVKEGGPDAQPYPQGAEREAINAAMAKLLKAVAATKSLEKALRALYGLRYVLSKAQARGGTYHRRVPKPGGGFHYIYDPDKYGARKDAHLDGEGVGKAYLSGKLAKFLADAGKKGLVPDDLADLVKRHGAKSVASALRDGVKNGSLTHKKGRFYQGKAK